MKTTQARRLGSTIALGKYLGLTRQAIQQWGAAVPERHVRRLEALSKVPKGDRAAYIAKHTR